MFKMQLNIDSGKSDLDCKIREYLDFAGELQTAADIRDLVQQKKYDYLEKIMMNRLSFGTAGMRGKMGPGYAAMNDLVIIQTSQGVSAYLDGIVSDTDKLKGVALSYDNRYNSKRFAHLAAVSFLLKGFKVFLFSSITPTPYVPFAVKKLGCLLGVMVTASHNPKEDNGYKVYWSNGVQILSPHDKNIQGNILKNLKPWPRALDTSLVWTSPLSVDPLADIDCMYYEGLRLNSLVNDIPPTSPPLKIVYTSMHGVAHAYIKKAFQKFNYDNCIPVVQQMYPDPEFPTVIFPNPEEKNCLDLSIATAEENNCSLILANDPDADRLAVAEKLQNGKWHVFTGNEIGALLGSGLWDSLDIELKKDPTNCVMVSSAVSSKILRSISAKEGFTFHETLTGFKWMANKGYDCMQNGMTLVFAFEEAIGYMCGSMVLDKDGIHAAIQLSKMATRAHFNKKRLHDLLRETYIKYGYHVSCNSYFICHDQSAIKNMFTKLRNFKGIENKYPEFLENGNSPFHVKGVRDLTTGYDSNQPDKKAILPTSSSTQMITFYFENGCEATLRTSGTEPKVKYYTEIIASVPESEWNDIRNLLHKMVDLIVQQWMQPENHGFLSRPS